MEVAKQYVWVRHFWMLGTTWALWAKNPTPIVFTEAAASIFSGPLS